LEQYFDRSGSWIRADREYFSRNSLWRQLTKRNPVETFSCSIVCLFILSAGKLDIFYINCLKVFIDRRFMFFPSSCKFILTSTGFAVDIKVHQVIVFIGREQG